MYMDLDSSILQSRTTARIFKVLNALHDNPNDPEARSNAESLIIQWQQAVNNKKRINYKGHYEKETKRSKLRQNNY